MMVRMTTTMAVVMIMKMRTTMMLMMISEHSPGSFH